MNCNLLYIPLELFSHILIYLDKPSIINICGISKHYLNFLSETYNEFWYYMVCQILAKPIKYIYLSVPHYNQINHSNYTNWLHVYFDIIKYVHNSFHMQSELLAAIQKGNFEIVRLLLINPRIQLKSMANSLKSNFSYILHYPDTFISFDTCLYYMYQACKHNYIDILLQLINDSRCDIEELNFIFLLCCKEGYIKSVSVLLQDSRINPTQYKVFNYVLPHTQRNRDILKLLEDSRIIQHLSTYNTGDV